MNWGIRWKAGDNSIHNFEKLNFHCISLITNTVESRRKWKGLMVGFYRACSSLARDYTNAEQTTAQLLMAQSTLSDPFQTIPICSFQLKWIPIEWKWLWKTCELTSSPFASEICCREWKFYRHCGDYLEGPSFLWHF